MNHILHYEEIDGNGEYVVITERDINADYIEENRLPGYKHYATHDIDGSLGVLPLDRPLFPR